METSKFNAIFNPKLKQSITLKKFVAPLMQNPKSTIIFMTISIQVHLVVVRVH